MKKISFTNQIQNHSSQINWDDGTTSSPNTHWKAIWSSGTTEKGSSGSPLLNYDHKIIGQLHGGNVSCSDLTQPVFYGKFSESWTGGGGNNISVCTTFPAIYCAVAKLEITRFILIQPIYSTATIFCTYTTVAAINLLRGKLSSNSDGTLTLQILRKQGKEVSGKMLKGVEKRKENLEVKIKTLTEQYVTMLTRCVGKNVSI